MSRKHKKKKGGTLKRFGKKLGKGTIKRVDSVAKFAGNRIKDAQDSVGGVLGALSNPLVLIGGAVLAVVVLSKM